MMLRRVLLALVVLGLGGVAAQAAEIRSFDIPTLEKLGRAIYEQDAAASRATDLLLAKVPDPSSAHLRGWIVTGSGPDTRVRFVVDTGAGPEAGFDILNPLASDAAVSTPPNRTLSPLELTMFAARHTAIENAGDLCGPGYNTVVLKDPETDGWLVWLLAPSRKAGAIPMGRHIRFSISADGKTVTRRDALSVGCLTIDPSEGLPQGATPAAAVVTHLVSSTPVETHVFLQLLYRTPIYVGTKDGQWLVDGGHITPQKPPR